MLITAPRGRGGNIFEKDGVSGDRSRIGKERFLGREDFV